jgi:hypothetical protein
MTGSAINMINTNSAGVLNRPYGIAADATYLYVTDLALHKIQRFNINTGLAAGWIGWISTNTVGASLPSSCSSGTAPNWNTFTPGWCNGGTSMFIAGKDGGLNVPGGIWQSGGTLYVVDYYNYRVVSFNATSGAFNGWIGVMGTNSAGCNVHSPGGRSVTKGWCKGTTNSSTTVQGYTTSWNGGLKDQGGGFSFYEYTNHWYNPYLNTSTIYFGPGPISQTPVIPFISGDNTYFYVAQESNERIDRFWINAGTVGGVSHAAGEWAGSVMTNDMGAGVFSMTPANPSTNLSTMYGYPTGLYIDATNGWIYHSSSQQIVVRRKLSDGSFDGWMGGVMPGGGQSPATCTPDGVKVNITPGWCKEWAKDGSSYVLSHFGMYFGKFAGITGISGDAKYIYVSDTANHRITRLPK